MEKKLYEAAIKGRVKSLREILRQDRLILDRVGIGSRFNASPLHVAASRGHVKFVRKLLSLNPELADVLDSRRRSPLHLASAKGHIEVVEALISANPEMCTTRDLDGRNSLHVAAMKGKVDVLKVLVEANPHAASATMDLGETILHLAVAHKQFEIAKYLLRNDIVDVNARNANGYTALDILQLQKETNEDRSIKDTFHKVGAKTGKNLAQGEWLVKKREALIIVASLIATMAFQAGVNPLGGVWQDNLFKNDTRASVNPSDCVWQNETIKNNTIHRAGEAVMAYNYPDSFPYFLSANTIGLVASLTTILLLISGLPFRKKGFMWFLVVIMWLTITSMAFTYAFSITVITPNKDRSRKALQRTIVVAVIVWCIVMALLPLVHIIRLISKMVRQQPISYMEGFKSIFKTIPGLRPPRTCPNSPNGIQASNV